MVARNDKNDHGVCPTLILEMVPCVALWSLAEAACRIKHTHAQSYLFLFISIYVYIYWLQVLNLM